MSKNDKEEIDTSIIKKKNLPAIGDCRKKLEKASGKPLARKKRSFEKLNTVFILLDCSGSMSNDTKMDDAKSGAINFAAEALNKNYLVGLIEFSTYAKEVLQPRKMLSDFRAAVLDLTPSGSTNMADAFRLARKRFDGKRRMMIIYVVSDGWPNNPRDTLTAAEECKLQGIRIMTLGTDDADKEFLDKLATDSRLVRIVERSKLKEGIAAMAKFLPSPKDVNVINDKSH